MWRRGSVVESWLLDLTAAALQESPELEDFAGRVSDSGEGRWTAIAAIEEGVPADVLTAALYARFSSRDEGLFANKVLSAMRKQFGGHHEKPVGVADVGTSRRRALGRDASGADGSARRAQLRELAELGRGQRLARRVEIGRVDEHLARPAGVRDAVPARPRRCS